MHHIACAVFIQHAKVVGWLTCAISEAFNYGVANTLQTLAVARQADIILQFITIVQTADCSVCCLIEPICMPSRPVVINHHKRRQQIHQLTYSVSLFALVSVYIFRVSFLVRYHHVMRLWSIVINALEMF